MARLLKHGAVVLITALCGGLPAIPAVADEATPPEPVPATATSDATVPAEPSPPVETVPAQEEPPKQEELPDLRASAVFDRDSYLGSDPVTMTLTITNAGAVAAPGVRVTSASDVLIESGWQGLDGPAGVLIEPNTTRVVTLSGHLANYLGDSVSFTGEVSSGLADAAPADNRFAASARLTAASGNFAGVIFGDRDTDRVMDDGETGVAHTTISLIGAGSLREAVTDEQGRFSFGALPAGRYDLSYSTPFPWAVAGLHGPLFDYVVVAPGNPDVRIPAVPMLAPSLHVNMFFDRDSYRVAEQARLTIVLANTGEADLTGITAACPAQPGWAGLSVGPGWGALAAGGITVPAGEVSLLTVAGPVADDAAVFGRIAASCAFGPAGYPFAGTSRSRATATVPGLPGTARLQLVNDADGDFLVAPGEALAGVPAVVTDPATGTEVARAVTDADGYLAVEGLPAQVYDVRIDGPWVPTSQDGIQLPVVAGSKDVTARRWYVEPGAAERNRRPNLRVSATFEKPAYTADERMRGRVTVTNIGSAAAEGVAFYGGGLQPALTVENIGELDSNGPGARIEAGATREFAFEGRILNPKGVVTLAGRVIPAAGDQIKADDDEVAAFATVRLARGTYAGVLYGDRNGNRVHDPGETLTGVPVNIYGGVPQAGYLRTTDGQGRFVFRDIPAGRYSVSFVLSDHWVVEQTEQVVPADGSAEALVRADRYEPGLRASIAFTKDSYAVGDVAHLRITLTNESAQDLTGVMANCTEQGNTNLIPSYGPGWGDIGEDGPGVAVPAGATATFDVWTVIEEVGYLFGYVQISCEFGAPPRPGAGTASATAKVPGGVGHPGGMLIRDQLDGEQGIAGTKVVLTEPGTGRPVARAVTDPSGRFKFRDVPAGEYEVVVVGPWKLTGCTCPGVLAGQDADDYEVRVVPGAVQSDPDAPAEPDPAEPDPAPEPAVVAAGRLATTGTDLLGLLAGGLALLVVGAGLRLVRRRRSPGR